jgi:iron(III) transport system permease protein
MEPLPNSGSGRWTRLSSRLTPRRVAFLVVTALLLWLVVVPVGFVIYGSLNTGLPGLPGVFSLRDYSEILSSAFTYQLLGRTLEFAVGSAVLSFVLGTLLAWFTVRTDVPGKKALRLLALFPVFMPVVLEVVAWKLLLDPEGGLISKGLKSLHLSFLIFDVNSMYGMILLGGILQMPLVYLWMWPALLAMDPSLEDAAALSHAGWWRTMRTVTLPLLLPSLAATFLINLVLAMEDIVIPTIIGLPSHVTVLASQVFLAYTNVPSDIQAACVYGVMLLTMTVLLMLVYRKLTARSERYAVVRGRGYRPTPIRLGRARWPCAIALYVIMFVVVVLPVFILVWTSLTPFLQVPSLSALHHLTGEWYSALTSDPTASSGLINSAVLSLATAVTVAAIAVIVGWMIARGGGHGRGFIDVLAFAPIAVPGLVFGLSLLWLYASLPIPIYGTLYVLWIAYVTRFIPYGVRLTTSAVKQVHVELEEVAYVSGAGWGRTLRTVTLPLIRPTIMVACVYTILRVFQEVGASLFLVQLGTTPYSVVAYNYWDGGAVGKTAAYGVVAIGIVVVLVVGVQAAVRRPLEL